MWAQQQQRGTPSLSTQACSGGWQLLGTWQRPPRGSPSPPPPPNPVLIDLPNPILIYPPPSPARTSPLAPSLPPALPGLLSWGPGRPPGGAGLVGAGLPIGRRPGGAGGDWLPRCLCSEAAAAAGHSGSLERGGGVATASGSRQARRVRTGGGSQQQQQQHGLGEQSEEGKGGGRAPWPPASG